MNILLDYDGTIHNTLFVYAKGFRKAYSYLVSKGLAAPRIISDEEISGWLGYSPLETWTLFQPELSSNERNKCIRIVAEEMNSLLYAGKGALYDNVKSTLATLKNMGHTLIFLSNCTHDYMLVHRDVFNLDNYYSAYYCGEDFDYAPKTQIFKSILKDYPGEYLIVGDRFKDLEMGEMYNIKTVACLYGFGSKEELAPATYKINNIKELIPIVNNFKAR